MVAMESIIALAAEIRFPSLANIPEIAHPDGILIFAFSCIIRTADTP